jgi:hypothetical protein
VQFQRYTRVGGSAGVGAPIAGLLRVVDPPLPKVGAVCGKAARTVLCGGRSAMSVPTAIGSFAPRTLLHLLTAGLGTKCEYPNVRVAAALRG